jgi:hypothetical protein
LLDAADGDEGAQRTVAGLIDRWAEDGRLPGHLRAVPKAAP